MGSTFLGLNIAALGLSANQVALDTTGHNVANASTPGYSRQTTNLVATQPFAAVGYQVGTGVTVDSITRARDGFMDVQYRNENTSLGYWDTKNDMLTKVQGTFNDTANTGINGLINKFWQSFEELQKTADDPSVRSTVRQAGVNLATAFNQASSQLLQMQQDINSTLSIDVTQMNVLSKQVADLNSQVAKMETGGDKANDLRDQRDLLLDQMSKLANVTITEDNSGQVSVAISGQTIVSKTASYDLGTASVVGPNGQDLTKVVFASNGAEVPIANGEMKGLLDSRDQVIQGYMNQLNTLAKNVVSIVNNQHQAGYDLNGNAGGNFFNFNGDTSGGSYARFMCVDDAIMSPANPEAGLRLIAASSSATGIPGNGDNALAVSQALQKTAPVGLGNNTVSNYYAALVGQLGVDAQGAERMYNNQTVLVKNVDNWRQSVSGVNMDEEMTNMIKFQRGYQAAARILSTMNDLLDVLINGIVK